MSEPTGALELLADGRLEEWQGLPPSLSLPTVTARFPPSDLSPVVGSLGSDLVPARYVTVPVPGFPSEMRVWFTEPDDRVVRMDATRPAAVSLEPLIRRLGEPEARLDTYVNVLRVEEGELVYAGRGLTLLTNPANRLLLGMAFYAGTTVDGYQRRLRLDLRLRTRAQPARGPGGDE
jgi:hypothetical protein